MKIKILWHDSTSRLEQEINDFLQEIGTGAKIHSLIMNHQMINDNVMYHFASILYHPEPSFIPDVPILKPDLY